MTRSAEAIDDPGAQRVVLWRYVPVRGLESCGLWRYPLREAGGEQGWALRGTAVTEFDGAPAEVRYRVICDQAWRTRRVHVGVVRGGRKSALRLEADGRGSWRSGGEPVPAFEGSLDVDLGIGASTNTLPIRRLRLPVGGASQLVAAWVRFPELSLEPLPQRYTRLAEDRYRYESLDSEFTAELVVDELGLVVSYERWCERVASFDPTPATSRGSR